MPVVYPQLSRQTSPTSDSQTAETSSLDGVNGSDTQTSKSTASSQDTKLQDNDDAEVVQDNDVVMEEPSDESESEDEPQETAAKKSRPQTQQSTRGAIRGEYEFYCSGCCAHLLTRSYRTVGALQLYFRQTKMAIY
mgnify:CR=1 FL=1